jgi:hypothetical protein
MKIDTRIYLDVPTRDLACLAPFDRHQRRNGFRCGGFGGGGWGFGRWSWR